MQSAWILGALHGEGSEFGHAPVIEDASSPCGLDPLANRRHAASRFTSDDEHSDAPGCQVDTVLCGDFRQAKCVGRSTAHDRCLIIGNQLQPSLAAHSASGQAEIPEPGGSLEARPETDKRTE